MQVSRQASHVWTADVIPLGVRVALGVAALVTLFSFGLVELVIWHERETLLADRGAQLLETARINGAGLRKEIDDLRADVRFLANVPPIQGIVRAAANHDIDPRDGNSAAKWKVRLQEIFAAQIGSHPEYVQIRYIGVAGNGRELVRVDWHPGGVVVTPPERLQAKGDRDYFQATVKLRAGEVHLSEINLNQEQGRIETPHLQVLRAATPVFGPDGKVFGIVIISLKMQALLEEMLANYIPPHVQAYLANSDGDYLLHPDASRTFGFDLGRRYRWQDDMPGLQVQAQDALSLQKLALPEGTHYAVAVRVPFDPLRPERHLVLSYGMPATAIAPRAGGSLHLVIAGIVMAAGLAIMLLLWLVRRTFAPLGQLTQVARNIAAGKYDTVIPHVGRGEVGALALAFQSMQAGVAEREAQFRAIAATSMDGFWMTDMAGRILEVNDAYVRRSGYAREELLAMRVSDLDAHEKPEEIKARIEGIVRAGSDLFETEHRRKDGTPWPAEIRVGYSPIGGGRLFAFMRDIAERKQAERNLRESEAALERAHAIAHVGSWTADIAGQVTTISAEVMRILRLSEPVIAWEGMAALIHPDDRQMAGLSWQTALASGWYNAEYRILLEGRTRWLHVTGQITYDAQGRPLGAIGMLQDISAEREADLALESYKNELEDKVALRTADLNDANARIQLILDSSADGIFGMDTEGRFTFANPAACEMLRYTPAQLIGRSVHGLIHHARPDGTIYPSDDCPLVTVLAYGRRHQSDSETFWRADGRAFPVIFTAQPIIRDGRVTGAVVNFFDFTERKAAEVEMKRAAAAAAAANRAKSEFLANMSHEIRTPLNAVLGLAQVGLRANYRRKARDSFQRIYDSGQHLLNVVNDILDFSKIEAGKLELDWTRFDLGEAVDHAVDLTAAQAYAKGLDFRVEEAADLSSVWVGDPLRLSQILVNLLANAIKFTEKGEVTLSVWRDETGLVLRVADSGIGMSPEEAGRLFRPFEQADGSITRRFGGTGLGLTICKRLVDLMGGTIDVESRAGQGTAFEVRLPLAEEGGTVGDRRTASADFGGAPAPLGGTVVLAGLPATENALLTAALSARGLGVVVMAAEAALKAPADLVVLDREAFDERGAEALEIAAATGRKLVVACTPGSQSLAFPLNESSHLVERPLRVRHLLDALAREADAEAPVCHAGPRLTGVRILAAEDNEVNRVVLAEILAQEGAHLVCAEDGLAALNRLIEDGATAYDIVVTDIQMPWMDGYEVARHVKEQAPDMPVIGLTAHALAQDRARCLAAGMVEHVIKPIDIDTLVAAILRHVRRAETAVPAVANDAAAGPDDAAAPAGTEWMVDWVGLATRFKGNKEFLRKLATTVLESNAGRATDLREAAARGDFAALASLAHSLKGMCGNLMAMAPHEQAKAVESAARAGRPEAGDMALQLAGLLETLLAELAARVADTEADG